MIALLAGSLVCGALGCTEPTEPPPPPELTVTTAGECARISFQITGPSSVTTWYPTASCTVGLVVIKSAGASTWNGTTRTLTLKMRVVNTSGQPVTLPVRLELPVDGKTVTLPEGVSSDSLVPLNMDSTLAGDRQLWLVWGASGTLAPGDSSETRWLTFEVKAPVTKGRFWFVSSGEEIPTVPAIAPDTLPAWVHDDSSYTRGGSGMLKAVVTIRFTPAATQPERQAAVDQVGGVVIGGIRNPFGEGRYWVRIDGEPTEAQLDSLEAVLRSLPQVAGVFRVGRGVRMTRLPSDSIGWLRADWHLDPDSSS